MIARLAGILLDKDPPLMVIDVGGVGYEIEAPLGVFSDLPENGQNVAIVIHHQFTQDGQTLYGFSSKAQREFFRKLLKISGIGAKVALNILSGASGEELASYVSTGDVASLTRLPGIGKKTAERIIVELRDKLDGMASPAGGAATAQAASPSGAAAEARAALASLGYKPTEVNRMIGAVEEKGMDAEEIIRKALQTRIKST